MAFRHFLLASVVALLPLGQAVAQKTAHLTGDGSGVSVTATGGSTARTLADQPQLSARDFSIVGNGTTDDTAQMQALFNAGASLGKPVFLQPGTFAVTCLTAPSGLRLSGAGPAAAVIKQTSGACPVIQGTGTSDVSISDIGINGNGVATYGIMATNNGGTAPARWRIQRVTVTGVTLDCYRVHTGTDIVIKDNTATSCGQHGITLDGTASQFGVTNNIISNVGGAGVIFMVGQSGAIVGNVVTNSGPNGDCITGYDSTNLNVQISANTCVGATNNGIHVGGSSLTITGNNVYNTALTGIFVAAVTFPSGVKTYGAPSNNVTITGNTVKNITTSNQNGLTALNCYECTVSGNTVSGATQAGILMQMSADTAVTGNHVGSTTGSGLAVRGSTNIVVTGNDVTGSSGDGYRVEQDASNFTGQGTVNSTANFFSGNYSKGNNRDYIDATGTTSTTYLDNYAIGATSAASPVFVMASGSYWIGPMNGLAHYQIATPQGIQARFDDVLAVDQFRFTAGTSGASPTIQISGSSTNRNINIVAKGTGLINLQSPVLLNSTLQLPQTTPANSSATCTAGMIYADANYVYVCTATNTLKRAALSTF